MKLKMKMKLSRVMSMTQKVVVMVMMMMMMRMALEKGMMDGRCGDEGFCEWGEVENKRKNFSYYIIRYRLLELRLDVNTRPDWVDKS